MKLTRRSVVVGAGALAALPVPALAQEKAAKTAAKEAGKAPAAAAERPREWVCPHCSSKYSRPMKFCGECGAALASQPQPKATAPAPQAERRLVSVLFADLVGFTPLAESRDPEEVREFLSSYFDRMRVIVERHVPGSASGMSMRNVWVPVWSCWLPPGSVTVSRSLAPWSSKPRTNCSGPRRRHS